MDRDPFDLPVKQQVIMLAFALLGGLVSWYAKVRAGSLPAASVMHLVGELTTSAFSGLVAYAVCIWLGTHPALTAAITGISGHAGTRAIAYGEMLLKRRANAAFGKEDPHELR